VLEPYYWCAAAVVAGPWSRWKSFLFYGMTIQTVGVAAMALVAAALLFPGSLTPGLRERAMSRLTFGYREARWIDRVVPKGETIMVESRAYALLPRPFAVPECFACAAAPLLDLFRREDVTRRNVSVLIPDHPAQGTIAEGCATSRIAGPERFLYATRSPVNQRDYSAIAIRVSCN
jgi:hypothetical protein